MVKGQGKVAAEAGCVLSIGKLATGQQDYHLQAVAAGAEDYYLGVGEAPGRWLGQGTWRLELSGRVMVPAWWPAQGIHRDPEDVST